MGIHISLYRNVCDRHPQWDIGRYADDRNFPTVFYSVPYTRKGDDDEMMRPESIDQLRDAIRASDLEWKERFLQLCDFIEQDPEYWVFFGW